MTKKIIMLVYNHFENDSRVLKEAQSLADNNYEVHIFAIWKNGLEKEEILTENVFLTRVDFTPFHKKIIGDKIYGNLKNLVYKAPNKDKIAQPMVEAKKPVVKPKQKVRLSILKFSINVVNKFFSYRGYNKGVKRKVKSKKLVADFIHAHDLNTLSLGVKLSRKQKAKLVYDSHELYVYRNKPYITPKWFENAQKRLERKNIQKCDAVITVSQSIVDYLEKTYEISTPHLIMNAPFKQLRSKLTDENNLKSLLKIPSDQSLLIYSGAVSFNRGLDKLIIALSKIENCHLVFLGRGNDQFKNYLSSIAEENDVTERFHFYGPVDSHQVTSFIQSADLGIAPIENVCLSYYFCAPNKIFEYIQGGIPVVSSNFPDMEEVVLSNQIGETFEPDSPKNIADTINSILKNSEKLDTYKNNVLKLVDKYKWENEEKKLLALYQQLN